jgi:ATP-dependent Clp protease ATP-binding subunit ClpX
MRRGHRTRCINPASAADSGRQSSGPKQAWQSTHISKEGDVPGEGAQQAPLKLVEGTLVKLPARGRKTNADGILVDTHNILFLVGGVFVGLERIMEKRLVPRGGIGFHAAPAALQALRGAVPDCAIPHPDDLRQFGLIPEFTGCFPVVTALEALDEAMLVRILTEPRNALVRLSRQLFRYEDVTLEFTEAALTEIARRAMAQGTGAVRLEYRRGEESEMAAG